MLLQEIHGILVIDIQEVPGLAYYSQNLQDSTRISISGQELQTIAAINKAKELAITVITDLDVAVQDFAR
jgi:hypothetical protein